MTRACWLYLGLSIAGCTGTPSATEGTTSAATVGSGGSGASGGQGGSAIGGNALVDDGLVVRYHIDEAASGQAPTELIDAAPDPLPLTLGYTPDLTFTEVEGHRGLRYENPGGDGRAYALVDATKIQSALAGSAKVTFEVVVDLEACTIDDSRLIHVGAMTEHGVFSLHTETPNTLHLHLENDVVAWRAPFPFYGRSVLHVVVDTTAADPAARVACYLNGGPCTALEGPPLTENEVISITSGQYFEIGNREALQRSIRGVIYYAAVYTEAFTETQVLHNAALLYANDDTP